MNKTEFEDSAVEAVFAGFPPEARAGLLALRARIIKVAKGLAPLEESLRWGQPAYLTAKGSTIRLGVPKTGGIAIYTHCQTTIVSEFRAIAPELTFDGNRAVLFETGANLPLETLDFLIHRALTYHL